jgi:hypothetical protein
MNKNIELKKKIKEGDFSKPTSTTDKTTRARANFSGREKKNIKATLG